MKAAVILIVIVYTVCQVCAQPQLRPNAIPRPQQPQGGQPDPDIPPQPQPSPGNQSSQQPDNGTQDPSEAPADPVSGIDGQDKQPQVAPQQPRQPQPKQPPQSPQPQLPQQPPQQPQQPQQQSQQPRQQPRQPPQQPPSQPQKQPQSSGQAPSPSDPSDPADPSGIQQAGGDQSDVAAPIDPRKPPTPIGQGALQRQPQIQSPDDQNSTDASEPTASSPKPPGSSDRPPQPTTGPGKQSSKRPGGPPRGVAEAVGIATDEKCTAVNCKAGEVCVTTNGDVTCVPDKDKAPATVPTTTGPRIGPGGPNIGLGGAEPPAAADPIPIGGPGVGLGQQPIQSTGGSVNEIGPRPPGHNGLPRPALGRPQPVSGAAPPGSEQAGSPRQPSSQQGLQNSNLTSDAQGDQARGQNLSPGQQSSRNASPVSSPSSNQASNRRAGPPGAQQPATSAATPQPEDPQQSQGSDGAVNPESDKKPAATLPPQGGSSTPLPTDKTFSPKFASSVPPKVTPKTAVSRIEAAQGQGSQGVSDGAAGSQQPVDTGASASGIPSSSGCTPTTCTPGYKCVDKRERTCLGTCRPYDCEPGEIVIKKP